MGKNALVSFTGNKQIKAEIALTGSKSECNRALIIRSLSKGLVKLSNMSNAADTATLNQILQNIVPSAPHRQTVDVGPAGTAMRFLTAYLSITPGDYLLTGTERMKQRPIAILAEALQTLGARISYTGEDGFPPLSIQGGFHQAGPVVKIRGDVSSQYISALLMIAPCLPLGLNLIIEGELTSLPYVKMTLDMLAEAGIVYHWQGSSIRISAQDFQRTELVVEPDWSAASYWYSIAALSAEASISLPFLKQKSLQGDSRIREIMSDFGVRTSATSQGIRLDPAGNTNFSDQLIDLKDCPDLAQTIIVCAAAMKQELSFTGLETLKIKETNRILALQTELAKIGVRLKEEGLVYTLDCSKLQFPARLNIKTYEDHRMAMAFAPLALQIPEVILEDMKVVEKSYPDFWNDLQKAGFSIREIE